MNTDTWQPISDDWPGYEIHLRTGEIRSVDRIVVDSLRRPRRLRGVVLVQVPDNRGRPQVTLSHRARRRTFRVDALLSQAHNHRKAHQ